MRAKIKGPKRFLLAGILFGLGSILLFLNFMSAKLYALLSFPIGLLPLSLAMFWFYREAKAGREPLKNHKNLYVGYLFAWLGGAFLGAAFAVPENERARVMIPSVICLLVGLGVLIGTLVSRLRAGKKEQSAEETRERDSKVGSIIGGIAAGIVLVPLFAMAMVALYHEQWVPAAVLGLPVVLLTAIFILVRRFGKRGKLKLKKESELG